MWIAEYLLLMITKSEFDVAVVQATMDVSSVLPKTMAYKTYIQNTIIEIVTPKQLNDIRNGHINQIMIDRLCALAKNEWLISADAKSLYCAAMAVATIVREYDWGNQYLVGNGLWELAQRIQNILV